MDLMQAVAAGVPSIVDDWSWRDRGLGDLHHLRRTLGSSEVTVLHQDGAAIKWSPTRTLPESRKLEFKNFRFLDDYVQEDVNAIKALRTLYVSPQGDLPWPILREKFWLGGGGLVTPLHFDPVETLHWVVTGQKRFKLYRPGYRGMQCPGGTTPFVSGLDPWIRRPGDPAPDTTIVVEAGQVLYLPPYWWHHVLSEGVWNASLNYVWYPSLARRLAHPVQWLRCVPHVRRQMARVRALY